jgi:hypothetical protein
MCICILHYQPGKLSELTVQLDLQISWRVLCLSVSRLGTAMRLMLARLHIQTYSQCAPLQRPDEIVLLASLQVADPALVLWWRGHCCF